MVPLDKLISLTERFAYLEAKMAEGGGDIVALGREYSELRPVVSEIGEYQKLLAEIAEAEGMRPELMRIVLMLLLASVIAIAMKIVGVLLITSLLIIPAATARRLSATPEQMAVIAAGLGVLAVAGGLYGSLRFDTPSGPSIVVAALVLFAVSIIVPARLMQREVR
jgi:hypothetical protein